MVLHIYLALSVLRIIIKLVFALIFAISIVHNASRLSLAFFSSKL